MRVSDCTNCLHFMGERKCKAFPEEIPREVYFNRSSHKNVLEGQYGEYVYMSKTPEKDKQIMERYQRYINEMIRDKELIQAEFTQLFISLITENGFNLDEWDQGVLQIKREERWDTAMEYHDFFLMIGNDKKLLKPLTGHRYRNWDTLRDKLWKIKVFDDKIGYKTIRFVVKPTGELIIEGVEETGKIIID